MSETRSRPFSTEYVLSLTTKHCRAAVDTSISRTLARIAEFDGNQEKSEEVFKTLAKLHTLKASIETFESQNA